ncbi:MAG TPA: energy transducer TonB [Ignavibacteriaceae bacterium]|nr:energy transducer TonB [Ignavibacteriaceae bacterium]
MPELIGGIDNLQNRIKYPDAAVQNKVEGKVYVLVLIDSLGTPNCPKILKGIGYGCDEEALRLVSSSKYSPGRQRGRSINADVMIPVLFKLPE